MAASGDPDGWPTATSPAPDSLNLARARVRQSGGLTMSRDDAARHTGGTEPARPRRRLHPWAFTRPLGVRPGRPRPTGSRPAILHRPLR